MKVVRYLVLMEIIIKIFFLRIVLLLYDFEIGINIHFVKYELKGVREN